MATLKAMFKLFDGYSTTVDKINKKTDDATNKILKASGATDKLNAKLEATGASANNASSGLKKLVSVAVLLAGAAKGINIVDEFTNTSARLGLINDGLQTQLELQDKIFAAADRSKGSYTAMASAVAKLGIVAKDAFGSNDETIAFTELLQKSMKVGGASGTEQSSAMLQLAQAMGSGSLKGDEFNSISENAPLILEAVAKYTGKSRGELKELASDGAITADIIKNAMFMASDDINAKFENLPYTFSDTWSRIKNGALKAFQPIMEATNNLINSATFIAIVDGIIVGVNLLSNAIGGLINFIVGNWPVIQAILLAIGAFLLYQLIGYLTAAIPILMTNVALWMMMNAPIIAIIATMAGIIYMLQSMGVTFEDIFGFIGGVVGVAIAGIYNLFLGLLELILGVINFLVAPFVNFTNFLGNIFTSPISSIIYLFQGLGDSALGILETIASAMDFVFGSNMADSVAGWRTGLKEMADAAVADYAPNEDYKKIIEAEYSVADFGLKAMDYKNSYDKGSSVGKDAYGGLSNAIGSLTSSLTGTGETDTSLGDFSSGITPIKIEGTGKDKKVDVDMADEDLQYLRDIAERDYINKFSSATLAPNITVKFTGPISKEVDTDKMYGRIGKILTEEIAMTAEGSH